MATYADLQISLAREKTPLLSSDSLSADSAATVYDQTLVLSHSKEYEAKATENLKPLTEFTETDSSFLAQSKAESEQSEENTPLLNSHASSQTGIIKNKRHSFNILGRIYDCARKKINDKTKVRVDLESSVSYQSSYQSLNINDIERGWVIIDPLDPVELSLNKSSMVTSSKPITLATSATPTLKSATDSLVNSSKIPQSSAQQSTTSSKIADDTKAETATLKSKKKATTETPIQDNESIAPPASKLDSVSAWTKKIANVNYDSNLIYMIAEAKNTTMTNEEALQVLTSPLLKHCKNELLLEFANATLFRNIRKEPCNMEHWWDLIDLLSEGNVGAELAERCHEQLRDLKNESSAIKHQQRQAIEALLCCSNKGLFTKMGLVSEMDSPDLTPACRWAVTARDSSLLKRLLESNRLQLNDTFSTDKGNISVLRHILMSGWQQGIAICLLPTDCESVTSAEAWVQKITALGNNRIATDDELEGFVASLLQSGASQQTAIEVLKDPRLSGLDNDFLLVFTQATLLKTILHNSEDTGGWLALIKTLKNGVILSNTCRSCLANIKDAQTEIQADNINFLLILEECAQLRKIWCNQQDFHKESCATVLNFIITTRNMELLNSFAIHFDVELLHSDQLLIHDDDRSYSVINFIIKTGWEAGVTRCMQPRIQRITTKENKHNLLSSTDYSANTSDDTVITKSLASHLNESVSGLTPLSAACKLTQASHEEHRDNILEILLDNKADLSVKDSSGETALASIIKATPFPQKHTVLLRIYQEVITQRNAKQLKALIGIDKDFLINFTIEINGESLCVLQYIINSGWSEGIKICLPSQPTTFWVNTIKTLAHLPMQQREKAEQEFNFWLHSEISIDTAFQVLMSLEIGDKDSTPFVQFIERTLLKSIVHSHDNFEAWLKLVNSLNENNSITLPSSICVRLSDLKQKCSDAVSEAISLLLTIQACPQLAHIHGGKALKEFSLPALEIVFESVIINQRLDLLNALIACFGDKLHTNDFKIEYDEQHFSAFNLMIRTGWKDGVKRCLQEDSVKTNLNTSVAGIPPIVTACEHINSPEEAGYDDIIKQLLDRGVNVNATDKEHRTGLYFLVNAASLDLIHDFIHKRGAQVIWHNDASHEMKSASLWVILNLWQLEYNWLHDWIISNDQSKKIDSANLDDLKKSEIVDNLKKLKNVAYCIKLQKIAQLMVAHGAKISKAKYQVLEQRQRKATFESLPAPFQLDSNWLIKAEAKEKPDARKDVTKEKPKPNAMV